MFNEKIVCTGENLSYINDYLIRLAAHYTDAYASDIIIDINDIEKQLREEHFKEEHLWYFGFYKNGVQLTTSYNELTKSNTRSFRAIYTYTLEIVGNCGFKEPQITIVRVDNH